MNGGQKSLLPHTRPLELTVFPDEFPSLLPPLQIHAAARRLSASAAMGAVCPTCCGVMELMTVGTAPTRFPATVSAAPACNQWAPSNRFQMDALGSERRLTQCMCPVAEKACSVGEFRCRDGSCISKSSRCNQLVDCEDASDEMNCSEYLPCALLKSCAPSGFLPVLSQSS